MVTICQKARGLNCLDKHVCRYIEILIIEIKKIGFIIVNFTIYYTEHVAVMSCVSNFSNPENMHNTLFIIASK